MARLRGTDGGDRLRGGNSADVIEGFGGADRLIGRRGDDLLDGGAGNDDLRGGAGADTLLGGAGDDRLNGGGGADRLAGGTGRDEIRTGGGSDVVVVDATALDGEDVVTDFSTRRDALALDAAAFGVRGPLTLGAPGDAGVNVAVLRSGAFSLAEAAAAVAAGGGAGGPGFFVFRDATSGATRLAFSQDLGDAGAPASALLRLDGVTDPGRLSPASLVFETALAREEPGAGDGDGGGSDDTPPSADTPPSDGFTVVDIAGPAVFGRGDVFGSEGRDAFALLRAPVDSAQVNGDGDLEYRPQSGNDVFDFTPGEDVIRLSGAALGIEALVDGTGPDANVAVLTERGGFGDLGPVQQILDLAEDGALDPSAGLYLQRVGDEVRVSAYRDLDGDDDAIQAGTLLELQFESDTAAQFFLETSAGAELFALI